MAASPGGVEVGRISVRVVPDTSRLGADLKVALDRVEAQTDLTISTSIDTTQLDIQARAAVDQAQAAAGDLHIKTDVDTSQVREAEGALAGASSAAQGFSSSIGGIATVAFLLGPALIPLMATLGALVATLVAPLAVVGGGLTLFGVLAGFTISETQKQLKAIAAAQTKLNGLTKGTAAYAAAAADLRAKQAALTPAQIAFQGALSKLKNAFDQIPKSIILKPIIQGLDLLARVLPLIEPLLRTVSDFLVGMLGDLDKTARSKGFKDFVSAFARQLAPDLRAFANIAGNVFHGLFGLFGAFNKQLSGSVLKSLENLTGRFATWGQTLGQSKGFKSFVTYVRDVGPHVAAALGAIAGAALAIVTAFAPIGGVVLQAITDVGDAIAKMPTDVLTTLAGAVVALVAGMKLLGPLAGIISSIVAAPEVAIVVGLVAGLTLGFIALYQRSKPLRRVLGDLGDFFETQLLPVIKNAAQKVIPALDGAFRDISKSIGDNKGFLEIFGKLLLVVGSAAVVGGILALVGAIKLIGKAITIQITFWHRYADVVLIAIAFIIRGVGFMLGALLGAFGQIIHGAALAFGWVPGLGGRLKAADGAFQVFTAGVVKNLNQAANNVDSFRAKLDAAVTPPKPIRVTVEDLAAIRELERLQAFRLKDKSLTVTERFQLIEQVQGPGGGINRPGSTVAPSSVASPRVQSTPRTALSGSGGSGALVHVDKMEVRDSNDILRQSQNRLRARAGGGVILLGAGP